MNKTVFIIEESDYSNFIIIRRILEVYENQKDAEEAVTKYRNDYKEVKNLHFTIIAKEVIKKRKSNI